MSTSAGQRARQLVARHEEAAKTLVAQAQAALADEHVEGALRALLGLHAEVIPALDRLAAEELRAHGQDIASGLSTVLGLLALWDELVDVDAEREPIVELILRRAAAADVPPAGPPGAHGEDAPLGLLQTDEQLAAQAEWLREELRARGVPRSRWWWRLFRRARGGTEDRARILVQRGAVTVFEREPPAEAGDPAAAPLDLTTQLGRFREGDRLTLQFQVPLPGQIAVLHAAGDPHEAELSILVPEHDGEAVERRHGEIVEVVGDLSCAAGTEHALIVLWAPEIIPPRWVHDVLQRRRVPPDARLWRYVYTVEPVPPQIGAPSDGTTDGSSGAPR